MTHRVLFVCGKNRLRSPTAEHVFSDWEGVETSSAGINRDADSPVTPELLDWADTVLVMESSHRAKLTSRFGTHLRGKRVASLDIPDDYEYMAPALVELLLARVPRHLPPRK
ncbi:protein-tyrosine-phosphatase [Arenimonas soli]|uniref:Protein-tyrosine-phosphatase n=1 Tax=Arenimonas soli TaxID=2269504 RepID=A0ABQ1HJW8_9GAMM|nr:low molecular weight protein tyrosine phosphatase family protein [Arenimonas soli]GGA78873.1 protein-tyrosine-phosphatase [Arenimonas soli]